MPKPRLLFISNLFPDIREQYRGLDNATVLHALRDRWDIRVLAVRPVLPWRTKSWEPREIDEPFMPTFVPAPYIPKIGSRVNHRLMARALAPHVAALRREYPFELVLAAWLFPDACAVAELARRFVFRFLAIGQGSDVHGYLRHPVRRKIIVTRLAEAREVITRSAELSRLLVRAGLHRARMHPIYNGVDLETFQPFPRDEARRDVCLPSNGPLILYVGNFYEVKNPLLLVEAHAALRRKPGMEEARLVMIGAGPLEKVAKSRADELGSGKHVTFAGRRPAHEVARHMQAADLLCVPSHNEGVPNVVLESFACGLPVVATRVGGIPEVHRGDAFGRLVPPASCDDLTKALHEVLKNPPDRAAIAEHGRSFSWSKAAAAYHELLESALP